MWCPKLNKEEQKFLGGELSPLFVFYMKTIWGGRRENKEDEPAALILSGNEGSWLCRVWVPQQHGDCDWTVSVLLKHHFLPSLTPS